jgi:hypothetical protein
MLCGLLKKEFRRNSPSCSLSPDFLPYHRPKQDLLPFRSGNDFLANGKFTSQKHSGGKATDENRLAMWLRICRLYDCRCYNGFMSSSKANDEIETLLKRKEQLDKRIRAAQERKKEREHLDNERRKLIVGAAVLDFMLANPDSPLALNLREFLNRHVTRPADRALLPALPASDAASGEMPKPDEPPGPDTE